MSLKKCGLIIVLITVLALTMVGVFTGGTTPISAEGSDPDWAIMNSNTTSHLQDVWGNSSTDVFAVGLAGTILHYNGSVWSIMTSPTNSDLWGVWGSNASDVFAVGDGGTILHYDGNEWTQMNSNSSESLRGVWGTSGEEVFAVGDHLTILQYNGSEWTLTNQDQNGGTLCDISGTNSSDVFTAGCSTDIMHYNGSSWSTLVDQIWCLLGLWVNNSSDVFGIGWGGGFGYWNGSDVNMIASGTSYNLYDVWGTAHDDVYMVGVAGNIEHYNGSACTKMETGSTRHLNGIWGNDIGDIFVVGDNGTILRNIKPWTYVLYMAGDNNLEGWLTGYILAANLGGQYGGHGGYSDVNINVVAQLDRSNDYVTGCGNWTTCRRFYVVPGTIPENGSEIEDIGEVNMGDPDTLVDFIQWTVANYPAQHYILNLVDHGSVFKMCFDFTDDDSLSINELQEALIETAPLIDIDILEFNMCLMSSTEVAYEIRNYADVMVGDERAGWFLMEGELDVIQEIKSNPDVSSLELGRILAQDWGDVYGDIWDATQTSSIDELVAATDLLARAIKDNWNTDTSAIKDAAQSVMTAINNSVIAQSKYVDWEHGLTIVFPTAFTEFNDSETAMGGYDNAFDFGADTSWRDFLVEYYSNMSGSWIEAARAACPSWGGQLPEGVSLYPMTDLYQFCENIVNTCTANLTVSSTSGGTVTAPGTGNYIYSCGNNITIEATADTCYRFVNWTGSGVDAGKVADPNSATTTITLNDNYTVQANFAIDTYTLTTTSGSGGTVTTPGKGTYTYNCGQVVNILATPNSGYDFVNWSGNNGSVADPNAASTAITMNGNYSIQANFTSIPNAPSNLVATAISSSQINLTWRDNSNHETGFKIERKTGASGTYAQITTVGANVAAYSNTGLTANTTYYYRVRSYSTAGNSNYCTETNARTLPAPPPVPTLTSPANGATGLNLTPWGTWSSSAGAANYSVQISTVSTFATTVVNTTGIIGTSAQVWPGVLNWNTRYYWRVNAVGASGSTSAWSTSRYFNTASVAPPADPSNLAATAISSSQINLTWQDNSNNETGFKIERKTGAGGTYAQITTVGANVAAYNNTGLTANTTYYYRVRAYNAAWNSNYCTEKSATTLPTPPLVPTLTSPANGATGLNQTPRLAWSSSSGAVNYSIQISTVSTFATTVINQGGITTTYFDVPGGKIGWNTRYYWRVNAVGASGSTSAWSASRYFNTKTGP